MNIYVRLAEEARLRAESESRTAELLVQLSRQNPPEAKVVVSRQGAAEMLDVNVRTIDKLLKEGVLEDVSIPEIRAVRISVRSILALSEVGVSSSPASSSGPRSIGDGDSRAA